MILILLRGDFDLFIFRFDHVHVHATPIPCHLVLCPFLTPSNHHNALPPLASFSMLSS
jgi:hypothetical protein